MTEQEEKPDRIKVYEIVMTAKICALATGFNKEEAIVELERRLKLHAVIYKETDDTRGDTFETLAVEAYRLAPDGSGYVVRVEDVES